MYDDLILLEDDGDVYELTEEDWTEENIRKAFESYDFFKWDYPCTSLPPPDIVYQNVRKAEPHFSEGHQILVENSTDAPIKIDEEEHSAKTVNTYIDGIKFQVHYLQHTDPFIPDPEAFIVGDINRQSYNGSFNRIGYPTYYKRGTISAVDIIYPPPGIFAKIYPIDIRWLGFDHLAFFIYLNPFRKRINYLRTLKEFNLGNPILHLLPPKRNIFTYVEKSFHSIYDYLRHLLHKLRGRTRFLDQNNSPISCTQTITDLVVNIMTDKYGVKERPETPDLPCPLITPISRKQWINIYNHLAVNKAAGQDNIPMIYLRGLFRSGDFIHFPDIWNETEQRYFLGRLCPISKEKDKVTIKDTLRPIVVQNLINKIYDLRFKGELDNACARLLPKRSNLGTIWQYGFTKGSCTFNCIDKIHQAISSNKIVTFLDFKCAFNNIKHNTISNALTAYRIPHKEHHLRSIKYQSWRFHNYTSTPDSGTPQGGINSPKIFNLALQWVVDHRSDITTEEIIAYCDDIAIITEGMERMLLIIRQVKKWTRYGLILNTNKCGTTIPQGILDIPYTPNYSYLGVNIKDIKAGLFFNKYLSIFTLLKHAEEVSEKTKIKLFSNLFSHKMNYLAAKLDNHLQLERLLTTKLSILAEINQMQILDLAWSYNSHIN
jgi:hypothetical protein